MKTILRLLRPHQYLKNGFVWVGFLFSPVHDLRTALATLWVFLGFCAAASCVYTFNDIFDRETDRQHPTKCRRPIASGAISLPQAWGIAAVLAALAFALSAVAGWKAPALIALYLAINLAYSKGLKHVVILDVFIISAGFMLRILAGTTGVGIAPSNWLLLTGLMLTLFLGFAKRRAELLALETVGKTDKASVRRVLDDYSPVVLDQLTGISAACSILSYGIYSVSADTVRAHGTDALIYTLPFVVYGMFRYLFLLHHRAAGNDTARDLLRDPHLIATGLGWLAVTAVVLR